MNRRARTVLLVAGLVVLGLAIGVGSALGVLRSVDGFGDAAGPWRASTLAGSPDADGYTRARVALGGLLALNRSETMYYVATTDSAGRPLRTRCTYRVQGKPPPARWWSITAYADDFFLFADDQHRYSLNGSRAVLDAQGRFRLVTAPTQPADAAGTAWLPTPGDRGLVLTLRLYNPSEALAAAPSGLEAPDIVAQGDCR